jgi:hypothetical protein
MMLKLPIAATLRQLEIPGANLAVLTCVTAVQMCRCPADAMMGKQILRSPCKVQGLCMSKGVCQSLHRGMTQQSHPARHVH